MTKAEQSFPSSVLRYEPFVRIKPITVAIKKKGLGKIVIPSHG